MRRALITLFIIMSIGMAYGQKQRSKWAAVNERLTMADYVGMRQILDTLTLSLNRDSVLWFGKMGEYYYWMSYETKNCADTAKWMFENGIRLGKAKNVSNMPYGIYYLHLGEVNYLTGDYRQGIDMLMQARLSSPFVSKDPSPVYKGLGMCHAMLGDYDKALTYLDSCDTVSKNAYSATRMKGKVYALKGDTASSVKCYRDFVASIRKEVHMQFDLLEQSEASQERKRKDRESWWMSVRPFITDCWRLEGADPALLYDVALLTKGILLQQNSALGITHKDIQKALNDSSVAIEWMMYETRGEKQLGAVVIRSDGTLRFVHSGTVAQFIEWWDDVDGIFENDECKNAIWSDQMLSAIGDARKVYFAPDGIFSQIGIEYMFDNDSVQLYRLTSTRELLRNQRREYRSAAIFGDIDYDLAKADTAVTGIKNDEEAYLHARKMNLKFGPLPNSKKECRIIKTIRRTPDDTLLLGAAATESAFRQKAGQYNILLVSTHGYCRTAERYENSDFPRKDKVDHSLSESGLVFCGFNAEQNERSCMTDGILSAREMTEMDLSNVGLCVVSACEGALGRVSGDGTYGVQRGLKAAGVGSLILSTWEVSDDATTVFMISFYQAMSQGKSVRESFYEARHLLRVKPFVVREADPHDPTSQPKTATFNDPRYYNAFILIDEI